MLYTYILKVFMVNTYFKYSTFHCFLDCLQYGREWQSVIIILFLQMKKTGRHTFISDSLQTVEGILYCSVSKSLRVEIYFS